MNYAKSFSFRVRDPRIFPDDYRDDHDEFNIFKKETIERNRRSIIYIDTPTCDLDNWMGL